MKYRILLACIVLCPSLFLRADSDASCMWYVYSETPSYHCDAQFRALFLKPTANNLYYAVEAIPFDPAIAVPIASPRWAIFDFHPDYHFGFDIGFSAMVPSRCSSVDLNWEHFASTTCASHTVTDTHNMIGPFSAIGPDDAEYKRADAHVKFTFDEVNARYGQFVNFGDFLHTYLFAGIGIARLTQCMATIFSNGDTVSRTFLTPASFTGAGPEFGFDLSYTIIKGLQLTGQSVVSLLMGTMKNHSAYVSMSPAIVALGNPEPNVQGTTVEKRTQMVPLFTERLGLAYQFCCCDGRCALQLEFGYEAKILLNAIQTTDLNSDVVGLLPIDSTVGLFARTYDRHLGNFALNGFYLAVDVAL